MTDHRSPSPQAGARPTSNDGASILGVVVAGGLSTRMGHDKAGITIAGVSLAQRAVERLCPQVGLVAFNGDATGTGLSPDVPRLVDAVPGHLGPLAGILTGLRLAEARGFSHLATVAVDTPFYPHDLVRRLADASGKSRATIAVAASDGALHPVFGLWSSALADDLQAFIESDGKRRVRGFIERHPHVVVNFVSHVGPVDPFFNINRPEDLDAARRLVAEHEDDRT